MHDHILRRGYCTILTNDIRNMKVSENEITLNYDKPVLRSLT